LQQSSVLQVSGQQQSILNSIITLLVGKDLFDSGLDSCEGLGHVAGQLLGTLVSVSVVLLLVQALQEDARQVVQLRQKHVDGLRLHRLVLLVDFDQAAS
jgi:hypothetical protein